MVDNTAPTVTSIERRTPTTSPTNLNSLQWLVTFSEALHLTSPGPGADDFVVSGTTVSLFVQPRSSTEFTVNVAGGDLDDLNDTVTLTFATGQNITDPAGNALVNVTPTSGTNDNFYLLDNTAPTVTSIERRTPTTSPTNLNSLQWLVTFSEALHLTSPGPGADDFVVSGTTVSLFVQPRSSTEFTVNVAGGDLERPERHRHTDLRDRPEHYGPGRQRTGERHTDERYKRQLLLAGQHRPDGDDHGRIDQHGPIHGDLHLR